MRCAAPALVSHCFMCPFDVQKPPPVAATAQPPLPAEDLPPLPPSDSGAEPASPAVASPPPTKKPIGGVGMGMAMSADMLAGAKLNKKPPALQPNTPKEDGVTPLPAGGGGGGLSAPAKDQRNTSKSVPAGAPKPAAPAAAKVAPCKTCGCADFKPNPFGKKPCAGCFQYVTTPQHSTSHRITSHHPLPLSPGDHKLTPPLVMCSCV